MAKEECKQCKPCLSNILSSQDHMSCAVQEIQDLLSESDHLSTDERKLLRSIRTYIGLAHNALNHVYDSQGRGDLKAAYPIHLRGDNSWGGEKNPIRGKSEHLGEIR